LFIVVEGDGAFGESQASNPAWRFALRHGARQAKDGSNEPRHNCDRTSPKEFAHFCSLLLGFACN
jgi:hypothetical protein